LTSGVRCISPKRDERRVNVIAAEPTVTVELEFPDKKQGDRAAASLREAGAQVHEVETPVGFLDPLTIGAIVFAIVKVAEFGIRLAEKIRDWNDHGSLVTIDAKGVRVREMRSLDEGWILYIDAKGVPHLYDTQQDVTKMKTILDAAAKGAVPDIPEADPKAKDSAKGGDGKTKDTTKTPAPTS
jgi:hypothetical protein